jgi:hypothetical protein
MFINLIDAIKNTLNQLKPAQSCLWKFISFIAILVFAVWGIRETFFPFQMICPYKQAKNENPLNFDIVYPVGENINLLWHMGGGATSMIVKDDLAYVKIGSELAVLDVKNTSDVKRIGYVFVEGEIIHVDEQKHFAYMLYNDHGGSLWRVDVSNPAVMSATRIFYTGYKSVYPHEIVGVKILAGKAHITVRHCRGILNILNHDLFQRCGDVLYIVEVASVEAPVRCFEGLWGSIVRNFSRFAGLERANVPQSARDGGRYYSIHKGGIKISDLAMNEIGSYSVAHFYSEVFSYRSNIYLTTLAPQGPQQQRSLHLINMTQGSDPKYLGELPFNPLEIAKLDNYVFTRQYPNPAGVDIFDMAQPTSSYPISLSGAMSNIVVMKTVKNRAYAVTSDNHFLLLDITEAISPFVITDIELDTQPQPILDMAVSGDYVYLHLLDQGLRILNISDEKNVLFAGIHDREFARRFDKMLVRDQFIYLLADDVVRIIDASNPAVPTEAFSLGLYQYDLHDILLEDNYLYIASTDGLRIFDVSDKAHPSPVSSFFMEDVPAIHRAEYLNHLHVENDYLYMTSRNGLQVLDVSSPTHPSFVGAFLTGDTPSEYDVECKYIYLLNKHSSLFILQMESTRLDQCGR